MSTHNHPTRPGSIPRAASVCPFKLWSRVYRVTCHPSGTTGMLTVNSSRHWTMQHQSVKLSWGNGGRSTTSREEERPALPRARLPTAVHTPPHWVPWYSCTMWVQGLARAIGMLLSVNTVSAVALARLLITRCELWASDDGTVGAWVTWNLWSHLALNQLFFFFQIITPAYVHWF